MRDLPPSPVFSAHDAAAAGWTSSAIRHGVRTGRLVRLRRGYYTVADVPSPLAEIRAAARAYPDGAVSHRSAAAPHRLPVVGARPRLPEMTFQPFTTGNRRAVTQYRATLRPQDIITVDGIAVTSVARTLVDVGRHAPISTSVAMIDAALHAGATTDEEIHDVLRFCWNWPRIRRAQRAVRLSDARSESPLESVSRLVMRWTHVPAPELQIPIYDEYGRFVARTDFFWRSCGVVGEADGRSKYDSRAVLVAEKERQEALEELGLVVTRWQWELPTRRPRAFADQLMRALERGAARQRSGLPNLWTL